MAFNTLGWLGKRRAAREAKDAAAMQLRRSQGRLLAGVWTDLLGWEDAVKHLGATAWHRDPHVVAGCQERLAELEPKKPRLEVHPGHAVLHGEMPEPVVDLRPGAINEVDVEVVLAKGGKNAD